jgi:hypothetical protein
MTETDDALSRLFREPLTADRDDAFASRVAHEVAIIRRGQQVYRLAMGLAVIIIGAGLGLSASAIVSAMTPAMAGLAEAGRLVLNFGSIALMAITATIAVLATQWMARRPV